MDQQRLHQLVQTSFKTQLQNQKTLKVDKRLSSYIEKYEKLRNIVGFQQEHLWRRYAIGRIIRRGLFLSGKDRPQARELLHELVMGHYIKDEDITESHIKVIDEIIEKYLRAIQHLKQGHDISKKEAREWLLGIMAVEIEDVLGLLDHEQALVTAMEERILEVADFPKLYLSEEQKRMFTFIATCNTLIKADRKFIAYLLIKRWHPEWIERDVSDMNMAHSIWKIKGNITQYEKNPFHKQMLKVAKPQAVLFWVLDQVIKKYQGDLTQLKIKVETVTQEIYASIQRKVRRQVWHSFVYLLVTKLSLIVLFELPYEVWRFDQVNSISAIANLLSPVLLLLILTLGIRVGNTNNTNKITDEVERLVDGDTTQLDTNLMIPRERSLGRTFLFNGMFALAYVVTYGLILYGLYLLDFNIVGGVLFVLFVTIVAYLAIRIRHTAERFKIIPKKIKVGRELLSLFALAILSTGQWIAVRFSQYNFVVMAFDLLFEAPFKTILFLLRDFSDFTREKRDMIE